MDFLVSDLGNDNSYIEVHGLCSGRLFLKIEAFNPAGSIKIKAAKEMIKSLEHEGRIQSGVRLIESSSGNLGVALSIVCAEKGIPFTCVIDPNTSEQNRKIITALGAEVVVVTTLDGNGGYLGSRIAYIEERIAHDSKTIWLNQYANSANPRAHETTTARAISEYFSQIDYLFVGAGTTGTLMGCKHYFSKNRPETKVVAVDSVGSVTFGFPASKRYIPGLGTSRRPEIFNPHGLHALERVKEADAVLMCRWLARTHGLLVGGSTGTVLAGLYAWRDLISSDATVIAISPDLGTCYLDTIYSDDWVVERFGSLVLSGELANISQQTNTVELEEKMVVAQ
jgi:2,3-diaminopropionate biosynthesis protein SbnA